MDGQSNEYQLSLFIYLFIYLLLSFKDYENKCRVLERNVTALKLALEEKTKEVIALQKDLNSLLSTMAKAQSSGPVLNGIDLSATEHGSSLEVLVVQSQTQVSASVFICLSMFCLFILCIDLVKDTSVE